MGSNINANNQLRIMKNPDLTSQNLLRARFLKNRFFDNNFSVSELQEVFFQGFPWDLNFNILTHVITHLYKYMGEEIVW